ncbi:MAG TPA: O-antigen ligase family protein [Nocardioides sp.]|nr:O-antigen ligase family protein [Nocardioides sp.]
MVSPRPLLLEYRPRRRLAGGYRSALVTPPPPRRERTGWTVALPLAAAVVAGLGVGSAPAPAALALLGVATAAALLLRLEWAAAVVVVTAVFEDYLARVEPGVTKLVAAVLVVSWMVRRCHHRPQARHRSPVLAAATAFAAVLAAATLLHNNGDPGLAVVLRYAGFLAVLIVLSDAVRDGLAPERLARWYVVACAAASLCGLAAFFLGADRRVGGPIGDPNDLAFFLLPAVALGPAVRGSGRDRRLWDLATVVVAMAIVGTLSRGALVGLAGMLVVAVLSGAVRLRVATGLVAAVAAAVLVGVAAVPQLVSVSLQQKSVIADQNVSERLQLWGAAAQMTVEHPVLGLGPGAFALDHQEYTSSLPDDVNHPLDVAHNTWLELSSELGVVGLAAFVAMLGLAYTEARRTWRGRGDPLAAAVCVSLVGTALAATFVTEQYYLPFWLLAVLAVGVAERREP